MKSLTYKLAAVFLAMSFVPLIVGIYGAFELQTAGFALRANDQSLQELLELLTKAGDSLQESANLQKNASVVTSQIANSQEETLITLKDMGDVLLPKTFAISQMRLALAETASAERALLLTLNMRHLTPNELKQARQRQEDNIKKSMEAMQKAGESYERLIKTEGERKAWAAMQQSLTEWEANHDEFMRDVQSLNVLVDDLIRGGPQFASSSRKAYDTVFLRGRVVRTQCEARLDSLNQALSQVAEDDVRQAMETQSHSNDLVRRLSSDAEVSRDNADSLLSQITDARSATADAANRAAAALTTTMRRFWFLVAFSGIGVLAFLILGFFMAGRISNPMRTMADQMNRIAKGDLNDDVSSRELSRNDEIGQLARAMQSMIVSNRAEITMANAIAEGDYTRPMPLRSDVDQLGKALGTMVKNSNDAMVSVSRAVERVGYSADAVREASRSLSQGAQTSATALEEITQTVVHVDHQAKDNAANAQQANNLAISSRDAAQRGYGAVTELVSAMAEIQQSGKKIASVAKLIDDIAFQTNLLALNAAVEAARAGRHGKGFSVVADEVRSLSGRSAKAARETSAMVAAMTERMEVGEQLAERTDTELREIVDATNQVAQIFKDISDASNAQSLAVAQISQGLSQIDEVIQENTNNAAGTATSAQTLSMQADELRKMVTRFQLVSHSTVAAREMGTSGTPALLSNRLSGETKYLPGPR